MRTIQGPSTQPHCCCAAMACVRETQTHTQSAQVVKQRWEVHPQTCTTNALCCHGLCQRNTNTHTVSTSSEAEVGGPSSDLHHQCAVLPWPGDVHARTPVTEQRTLTHPHRPHSSWHHQGGRWFGGGGGANLGPDGGGGGKGMAMRWTKRRSG